MAAGQTKREAGSLEARLTALTRRVKALEREGRRRPERSAHAPAEALGSDLALLEQLRKRQGRRYRTKEMRGAVAYGGAVVFGEREYLWIREHPLPEITKLEPERLAQALATLGHPARLVLLRALLQRADLVVLDESFAALDPDTLQHAMQCVLRRAPTLVVIAHP